MEQELYEFIETIKELLSPDLWESILMDCSKNEVLILWMLHQRGESNMSQIAEYIHTPLNTATGIVARMEKRKLICRTHSKEDKRVVLIALTERGRNVVESITTQLFGYIMKVGARLTNSEKQLLRSILDKVVAVLREEKEPEIKQTPKEERVRRIEIL